MLRGLSNDGRVSLAGMLMYYPMMLALALSAAVVGEFASTGATFPWSAFLVSKLDEAMSAMLVCVRPHQHSSKWLLARNDMARQHRLWRNCPPIGLVAILLVDRFDKAALDVRHGGHGGGGA